MTIGEGGVGKGHFQMYLATHVAAGWSVGPFAVRQPGKVILISREDDRDELHRRLHAAVRTIDSERLGEGCEWRDRLEANLHLVDIRGLRDVTLESRALQDAITEKVQQIGGAALIALDPLGRLVPEGCKLNDQDGAGRIHVAIDSLVAATGANVMVVHHVSKAGRSTKPTEDRGAGASSGSHLLEDLARTVLRLVPLPGAEAKRRFDLDPRRGYVELTAPKANYSPTLLKPRVFAREDGGALRYVELTSDTWAAQDRRVKQALADHPEGLTSDEWEKVCKDLTPPISRERAEESRGRLLERGEVVKTPNSRLTRRPGPKPAIYVVTSMSSSDDD